MVSAPFFVFGMNRAAQVVVCLRLTATGERRFAKKMVQLDTVLSFVSAL